MIRIHTSGDALDEKELNRMEQEDGLTLIAANCAVTNEWANAMPGMSFKHDVTRWTYHFRVDPNFVAPGEFNG